MVDTEPNEWVVYNPPKSVSFGHQSLPRDARRAWPMVGRFLTELTTSTLGPRIELTCYLPSAQTDAIVAVARLEEARHRFGPEISNFGNHKMHPRWQLAEAQLNSAIQFALEDDKFPKQQHGPTRLYFSYQFCWTELKPPPRDGVQPESRSHQSHFGLSLGQQGVFIQPYFIYPVPSHSEFLKFFIDRTEPLVPFRFRNQYFQRWLPPRTKGKFGRRLRLDANWRRGSVIH
jgi:hypothetical protein